MYELPTPQDPKAFLQELRRRDFPAFLDRAWTHISGGQFLDHNWHIDALAHQLERVTRGDSRRLLVNIPPRNGKTNIVSIAWVAWMLGQNPSLNFICVSYANEQLSGKLARDCLSIIQSSWYRELFPRTIISPKRSASLDFETSRGGGRLSTSVGGTLTGRGADFLILDDVIKPEDANSETVRNSVNEWFRTTLVSRLNDNWKGRKVEVIVEEKGFRWDDQLFPSLSAAATAIAGSRWNGPRFFGLRDMQ